MLMLAVLDRDLGALVCGRLRGGVRGSALLQGRRRLAQENRGELLVADWRRVLRLEEELELAMQEFLFAGEGLELPRRLLPATQRGQILLSQF